MCCGSRENSARRWKSIAKRCKADRDNVPQKVKLALAQEVILESRESAIARRAEVMAVARTS